MNRLPCGTDSYWSRSTAPQGGIGLGPGKGHSEAVYYDQGKMLNWPHYSEKKQREDRAIADVSLTGEGTTRLRTGGCHWHELAAQVYYHGSRNPYHP